MVRLQVKIPRLHLRELVPSCDQPRHISSPSCRIARDIDKFCGVQFGQHLERPFGGSCSSDLGYVGNAQIINLGFDNTNPDLSKRYDCSSQRTILHEMGHALGLYHENQRCDSGNYIVVNQNNALADFATNYQSYCDNRILSYGAYDFDSVMHYATNYFNSDITRLDILRKMPTGNVAITYTNKYYGVTYSPPRLDVIPSSGDVAVMNFRQP
jgi:Astacin (Peptidase family M12A)